MTLRQQSIRRLIRAFSLLELMIAVGMLSVVIFALYAMFDQTQKAFKQSLNQAELSEGGRAGLDLMVRSLERAASPQVDDALYMVIRPARASGYTLVYPGDGDEANRTQPLRFDEIFFTYREPGNLWHVAGLFLGGPEIEGRWGDPVSTTDFTGLGTLYLFDEAMPNTNLVEHLENAGILGAPNDNKGTIPAMRLSGAPARQTNLISTRLMIPAFPVGEYSDARKAGIRLLEGVLQFRITAFDADGRPYNADHPFTYDILPPRIGVNTNNPVHVVVNPENWARTNGYRPAPVQIVNVNRDTAQVTARFFGTNVPAAIELELTLLDGKQLAQFRSLPVNPPQARDRWLKNNSGALQTLRQRVVLRSAPQ